MTLPYALYRYFDIEGNLLYVGITGDLARRDRSHISASGWMQLTASSVVKRYETLAEVKRAESDAIATEHPLFNKMENDTPAAKERLRAHLEKIGRKDLLPSPSMLPHLKLMPRSQGNPDNSEPERMPTPPAAHPVNIRISLPTGTSLLCRPAWYAELLVSQLEARNIAAMMERWDKPVT